MAQNKPVHITMLGPFTVRFGERVIGPPRWKDTFAWQLMKYLAANNDRWITMEELDRVLWPEENMGSDPLGMMRVRVHRLRDNLNKIGLGGRNGLVQYSYDRYRINADYELLVDIEEIAGICLVLRSVNQLPWQQRVELCRKAIELFGGKYLENSPADLWVEQGRRHSRELFSSLTESTLLLAEESGQHDLVALLAEKALLLIPDKADVNTKLMDHLLVHGYTAEAVSHYAKLSRISEAQGWDAPPLTAFFNRRIVHEQ